MIFTSLTRQYVYVGSFVPLSASQRSTASSLSKPIPPVITSVLQSPGLPYYPRERFRSYVPLPLQGGKKTKVKWNVHKFKESFLFDPGNQKSHKYKWYMGHPQNRWSSFVTLQAQGRHPKPPGKWDRTRTVSGMRTNLGLAPAQGMGRDPRVSGSLSPMPR